MLAGKAMGDRARKFRKGRLQNVDEVVVSVPLMQEDRQAGFLCDLKLAPERIKLCIAWGEISEIVEAAFTNGDDSVFRDQGANERIAFIRVVGRVVRVHASSGKQHAVAGFCQGGRACITIVAAACDDNSGDTRIGCTLQHLVTIVIETVMRQVGANINQ